MVLMMESITHSVRSMDPWRGLRAGAWQTVVDVRCFLQSNVQPYAGGAEFLAPIRDDVVEAPPSFAVSVALRAAGLSSPNSRSAHAELRNEKNRHGCLQIPAPQMEAASDVGLLHSMPEPLSRCATAADCRRVALYGVDFLRAELRQQLRTLNQGPFTQSLMQRRRDVSEQMLALEELHDVALSQGVDISRPAANAREAAQWMTLAAMAVASEHHRPSTFPIGRMSAFLDVYIQRDIDEGRLNEPQAQELIDELLIKLGGMQRLGSTGVGPAVPIECIGGMTEDAQPLVTRTSFRVLHALRHCMVESVSHVAVLWSSALPRAFRHFCTDVARDTGRISFENDSGLRSLLGHDYVTGSGAPALRLGQQVLLDAGHVNLPKALLFTINGGVDEESGVLVIPGLEPLWGDVLEYEEVVGRLDRVLDWIAATCVNAFNGAHFLHQRLGEASLALALHDSPAAHVTACSLDGLAELANSLSAIRYARVQVLRNEDGLAVDFKNEEPFPSCGGLGGLVDGMVHAFCDAFVQKLRAQPFIYRDAQPVVVPGGIAANIHAGSMTGNTPSGRRAGEAFCAWKTDEARRWSAGNVERDGVIGEEVQAPAVMAEAG